MYTRNYTYIISRIPLAVIWWTAGRTPEHSWCAGFETRQSVPLHRVWNSHMWGKGVGIHYSSQLRRDRLIVPQEHHLKHDLFHVGFPGCEIVEQPQLLDTESMCCIEIIGLGLSAWGVWRDCKKTCTMARISSVGRISMLRFLFHWQPISATNTASCPRKPNRTGSKKKKKQTMPTIDEPLGITFFWNGTIIVRLSRCMHKTWVIPCFLSLGESLVSSAFIWVTCLIDDGWW